MAEPLTEAEIADMRPMVVERLRQMGCEGAARQTERLLGEVTRARAYLRKIEWSDRETGEDRCPECGAAKGSDGKHEMGCELDSLIGK